MAGEDDILLDFWRAILEEGLCPDCLGRLREDENLVYCPRCGWDLEAEDE